MSSLAGAPSIRTLPRGLSAPGMHANKKVTGLVTGHFPTQAKLASPILVARQQLDPERISRTEGTTQKSDASTGGAGLHGRSERMSIQANHFLHASVLKMGKNAF